MVCSNSLCTQTQCATVERTEQSEEEQRMSRGNLLTSVIGGMRSTISSSSRIQPTGSICSSAAHCRSDESEKLC